MDVLLDNLDVFRRGFLGTLSLTVVSGLLALALGVVIAGFRVSPVPPLRAFGTAWVTVLRNTPLTLLFFIAVFALPRLGVSLSFYTLAILALGFYTSAFVCEAVRSGINTVPLGQAEAARSLGMTFTQTLTQVVLPQAFRTVVPPIGSLLIALTRNSSIAGAFSVFELFSVTRQLNEDGYSIWWLFFWVAVCYLVMSGVLITLFRFLENRLAVAR
ncbi:amino acid ABC transporter permease [Allostreptomyces psammosilenae]|uniref:Glutamate transport system permease protein n=1 Tax=Allostreptomyces psammosilenae TaxID=1892865 RepID=A0A852ZKZ1_9ACTN|nr:amino acid ABC transporter permease [Allostreptomyces psammosilenae]NYI03079.1 glutamate transport system permease protein [Allostreptomyces psammosilenae]